MLAPLAGWSDLAFRSMVKKFAVDITVSEMISSYALVYNPKKTLRMIEKSPLESPFSVQIAGNNSDIIKKSVEILNTQNGIDIIDLNCGCPAPKVSSHGSGSALLKNLNLLADLVNTIKLHSNKPYTSLKVRLGFDKKIPLELASMINDSGADFVVVHGRTKIDAYKKEKIDYSSIAQIKEKIRIPLIANGEIDSFQKAKEVLKITNANGVMIGRFALKEPWIFYQLKHNTQELPNMLKKDIVLEHFDNMIRFYGERGCIIFRKNLHNYAKSHNNASDFRIKVNAITSPKIMRESIIDFFSNEKIS
ncbi:tRNA dihydrouridine synthase DusB [Helicobacter sp. 16-1353]|nr:tRNA dihydrouridine synthase DusB [Helicobacter sp. 16-1353]